MTVITLLPSGLEFEVVTGDTILATALSQKLAWPNTCGGKARCTTCAYILVSGGEYLSAMDKLEQQQLIARKGRHVLRQNMRLACQTKVTAGTGKVVIQKNLMLL